LGEAPWPCLRWSQCPQQQKVMQRGSPSTTFDGVGYVRNFGLVLGLLACLIVSYEVVRIGALSDAQ